MNGVYETKKSSDSTRYSFYYGRFLLRQMSLHFLVAYQILIVLAKLIMDDYWRFLIEQKTNKISIAMFEKTSQTNKV